MGSPLFLVENFFNVHQFPDHVIDAEEEPTGYEAWRLGTGRRTPALNKWKSTTANSDTYVDVECDRVRSANVLIIDGHNLAGYDIELRGSMDDHTTDETILDVTIPSVSMPGTLDDGVLTEEGVYARRFDTRSYLYWRPFVDAMGAGLIPEIAGIYLGLAYAPEYLDYPLSRGEHDLFAAEVVSEAGYLGRGIRSQRPGGTRNWRLSGWSEYDLARYHIEHLYGRGYPMWMVDDDEQADRCIPVVRPGNQKVGFVEDRQWPYGRISLPYIEHERP